MEEMRTIRVTGKGMLKIRPDTVRVTVTVTGRQFDYAQTLRHSAEDTEALKDLIAGLGFERGDLKTLLFNVNTETRNEKDRGGNYKTVFLGYSYTHMLKLEFPSDNERLGKLLYALARCPVRPEFSLSYTVSDPEAAKNELLGKAVLDAKNKAAVLTQAAGAVLKEIRSIDYSWGRIDLEYRPMSRELSDIDCMTVPNECLELDIEPDDIEVSDTVTVIWEIA